MNKTYKILVFIALLITCTPVSRAQSTSAVNLDSTAQTALDTPVRKMLTAILVQLRSERNRITALTKNTQTKLLQQVKIDASAVTTKMIADFHDHLNFCPVYYFVDSNIDLIKKHLFTGVLFNADSTPVSNSAICDTNHDYLIVYYGYPDIQSHTDDSATYDTIRKFNYGDPSNPPKFSRISDSAVTTMEDSYANYGEPFGRGLVINNSRFRQISFIYKLGYNEIAFRLRRVNRKYIYHSHHFDIEYFPFADELNTRLMEGRRKIPFTHYVGTPGFWQGVFGNKK